MSLCRHSTGTHPQEAKDPIHQTEYHRTYGYGSDIGGITHVSHDSCIDQSEKGHRDIRHDGWKGNL